MTTGRGAEHRKRSRLDEMQAKLNEGDFWSLGQPLLQEDY